MYHTIPAVPYTKPNITLGGENLAVADKFTYLGRTLSKTVTINEEVNYRIVHASVAFGRLHASVLERRGIRLKTKLKLYHTVIMPSLPYACETWTV